jgi:hypothetical protein
MQALMHAGALNWATGETVAVKEIQLSNIPKGELGQIMVRPGFHHSRALRALFKTSF